MVIGVFCCYCAQAHEIKKEIDTLVKANATIAKPTIFVKPVAKTIAVSTASPAKATMIIGEDPKVHNMAEFRKTPAYSKRKATLDKATPGPQNKPFKFQDGSSMTIKLDRSQPTDVLAGPVTHKDGAAKKTSSGGMDCINQQVHLTATSDNFLNNDYSGSTSNIYPGACYTYDNLTNGSWKEQKGDRNPIYITTDNPNLKGNSYVIVQNPNMATIESGIGQIFRGFENTNGNESLTYQVSDAINSSVYNLQIGAAASGFGADLSNVYKTGNQANHVHLTIDAIKTLFTISTFPPDNGFFKDAQVESTPYLSVISEVSYGVRVLANADLTFSSEADADNFKASYSFIASADLNIDYSSGSKSEGVNINGMIIGGPGGQVVAYSIKDLKDQIAKAFKYATYQNARPVKYKACSMAGDVLNTYSATDDYTVANCVPTDGGSPQIQDIIVSFQQGSDGKDKNTDVYVNMCHGMTPVKGDIPMFISASAAQFADNGQAYVVLKPNPAYKGSYDMGSFQKDGGGHFYISIGKSPRSSLSYDLWQIDGITVTINLKPSAGNPNAIGGPKPLLYNFQGPNEINLRTDTNPQVMLAFDRNFTPVR